MNENSSNKTILEALPEDYTFNLSDFALFLSVMKNKTAYENTLSIILDEPDLKLKEVKVEQVVLNKSGKRAIRLDAWARDEQNRHINTEMQNDAKQDNLRKRSRFYQGLLDTPVLKSGKKTKYKHLPSTIIIFITRDDIFRCDSAMYTFTEQCEEVPGLHLDDGTKKIFLNMTSRNGRPELISLLQYMKNTTLDNPEIIVNDKRIQSLDKIVNEVKQSEEWEAVKMNILEIGIEKGIEQGIEQGKAASILELLEETGKVSEQLRQKILDQHDSEILSKWLKLAAKAETIEEFERRIAPDKAT